MGKVTRYIVRAPIIAVVVLGLTLALLTMYDALVGDSQPPEFAPLDENLRMLAKRALYDLPVEGITQEIGWRNLQPSLTILNKANPSVSRWVTDLHYKNRLRFVVRNDDTLAKYDFLTGYLYINKTFFVEIEGKKAAQLSHEYRHSLQNYGKLCRYMMSFSFFQKGNEELVENDAYLYEHQAIIAIFGDPS